MNTDLLPISFGNSPQILPQYTTKLITQIRRIKQLSDGLKIITKAVRLPSEYQWQVLRSAPLAREELIRVDDRLFLTQKNLKVKPQTLYRALEASHNAYPIREIQIEGSEETFTYITLMRICLAGVPPSDLLVSKTIMFKDDLAWSGTLAELKLMLKTSSITKLPEVDLSTFLNAWRLIVREAILPQDEQDRLTLLELRGFIEDQCHNYEMLPSFSDLCETIEQWRSVRIDATALANVSNWELETKHRLELHTRFCPRLKWVNFITKNAAYEYLHDLIKGAYSTSRLFITPVQCKLRNEPGQPPVFIEPDFFYNVVTLFSQVSELWTFEGPYELDVDRETLDFARELYQSPYEIDAASPDERLWLVYDFVRRHSLPPPGPYCPFTKKLNAVFEGDEITLSWNEIVLNWENAHTIHIIGCDTAWTRRDFKAFLRHGSIKLSDLQTSCVCELKGDTRTVSRARLRCLIPNEGYWPYLDQVDPDVFDLAWEWQFNGQNLPYATESEQEAILEVHAFYRQFTTRASLEEFELDYLLPQIYFEWNAKCPFLWLCTRLLGQISHPKLVQSIEHYFLSPAEKGGLGYIPKYLSRAPECGYLIAFNPPNHPFENHPLHWKLPLTNVIGVRIQDDTERQRSYICFFDWKRALPALQKLVFAHFPPDFLNNLPYLPQLRCLRFCNRGINITDLQLLFEKMPNLEELEFYYDGSFSLQPILHFSQIKHMRVNCTSEAQLLEFPVLPNITKLTITVMAHLQPACFSSFPNLKSLCYSFDSMELVPFFKLGILQKLEGLNITQLGDAWLATRLTDERSSTYRLPNLKGLALNKINLHDGVRLDLPNLTDLAIFNCDFFHPFHTRAPKLERLFLVGHNVNLHIKCGVLTSHHEGVEVLDRTCRAERLVLLPADPPTADSPIISNRSHLKHLELRYLELKKPASLSDLPQLQTVHFHHASGNTNFNYHNCPRVKQSTYYPLRYDKNYKKRHLYWILRMCMGLFLIALADGTEFFPQHRRRIAIALTGHWISIEIYQRAMKAIGEAEHVTERGIKLLQKIFIVAQCIAHLVILVLTSALLVKLPMPTHYRKWSWTR